MKRKKNNKQNRKKNVKYSMCTLSVLPLSQRSESTYVAPAKYTPRRKTHRNTRGCVFSICPGRPSRRLHAPEVVDSCRREIGRSKKLHAAAHVGKQQIMKQATSAMPRNGLSQWGDLPTLNPMPLSPSKTFPALDDRKRLRCNICLTSFHVRWLNSLGPVWRQIWNEIWDGQVV